ncbi:UNVERIFIED_CONTAM: hypothetical protein Sangu_0285000 [Sesamum angustifolium]|uniref:Uncharacterized protein n=1 Tax=Sesamum angustifolium TaxID=2727405 RepID=A0AAW2QPR0_9LAMI
MTPNSTLITTHLLFTPSNYHPNLHSLILLNNNGFPYSYTYPHPHPLLRSPPLPTPHFLPGFAPIFPLPSPELPSGDISQPPASPSPSPALPVSPPAPPPSDLAPDSPSPVPFPGEDDDDVPYEQIKTPTQAPSPAVVGDVRHEDQSNAGDLDDSSGGMSGGKKAGVAIGVISAACVVGLGALVYKKRQQNIRRAQYGYAARREFL